MIFNIQRETILHPLSEINGVVEKKQTLAILGNFYLKAYSGVLSITASDSEVEMVATCQCEIIQEGEVTVPARKLFDICRALPDGVIINFTQEENKALIQTGRSKFSLATLPAQEFPLIDNIESYDSLILNTLFLLCLYTCGICHNNMVARDNSKKNRAFRASKEVFFSQLEIQFSYSYVSPYPF